MQASSAEPRSIFPCHLGLALAILTFGSTFSSSQAVLAQEAAAPTTKPAPDATAANTVIEADVWQRIVHEGKEGSKVMAFLDHLVNRIGPRLTSSRNIQNAQEWALAEFKAMGLANARLEQWGEFPVGFDRGPASGAILEPEDLAMPLAFSTNAWTAGTKGPAEGPVIEGPDDVEEAHDRVRKNANYYRDAWILMRGSLRRSGTRELGGFLADNGAHGFLYSGNETRPGKEDPKELHRNLLMTGGRYQIRWPELPRFPEVQVRWDQFQSLARAVQAQTKVRVVLDIRNWFRQGPVPNYNVIAELEGFEKPHEYVVVGGHIDSWDGATGTTDNGTGTSTTLEAARILTAVGARPRRTIRFMLWSGEEQGLLGSRAWVQKNRQDVVANCQAALVHDGGTNAAVGIIGSSQQLPLLERAFAGFDTIDASFPFTITEGQQPSYGSDHASFITVRAPGFYWLQKGRARYNFGHHTQHDTFALAVPEYQKQTATVAALGALALANIEERMPAPVGRSTTTRPSPAIRSTGISVDADLQVTIASKEVVLGSAGVQAGDRILELDGNKVEGGSAGLRRAFVELLRSGKAASSVVVQRNGEDVRLKLELKAADEKADDKANDKGDNKADDKGDNKADEKSDAKNDAPPRRRRGD